MPDDQHIKTSACGPQARDAINRLIEIVIDGLRHGHFRCAITSVIGKNNKRDVVIEAGKSHKFTIIQLYDREAHGDHRYRYGAHDPGVCALCFAALSGWLLGFPDRAWEHAENAIALGRDLEHPFTGAMAYLVGAGVRYFRREAEEAIKLADKGIAYCAEHGVTRWVTRMRLLRCRALFDLDGGAESALEMSAAMQALLDSDTGKFFWPWTTVFLAELDAASDRTREGLDKIVETFPRVEQTGEHWIDSELHRATGELLLAESAENEEEAVPAFQTALFTARSQEARSLELRAATSLARLWNFQGKSAEARDLLAPVYGWFTEGFDTADLKEAKALLDELT